MARGIIDRELTSPGLAKVHREPSVVSWNRLEGRPRKLDAERALRAEIRDALWMLSRQYQLGEFNAEDAGSAIFAKLAVESSRLTSYAARDGGSVPFDEHPPLETRVERESLPLDQLTRAELGLQWADLLHEHGVSAATIQGFQSSFSFPAPPVPSLTEAYSVENLAAWQFSAAVARRSIDGAALLAALETQRAREIMLGGAPIPVADHERLDAAELDFSAYIERRFSQPGTDETSAWNPHQLEYQFACRAPQSDGRTLELVAEEYTSGHLDWYAFSRRSFRENGSDESVVEHQVRTTLPTPVSFPGMPGTRFWAFEDRRTDFGKLDADPNDLARLLMAEFGLLYSNDWMLVPVELPVGGLAEVLGLVVVDVFGQRQVIRHAGHADEDPGQEFNLFQLSPLDDSERGRSLLFLPPVVGQLEQSAPVEEVRFFRDEMANMVWGVETRIADELAGGRDGLDAGQALRRVLGELSPGGPSGSDPTAVESRDEIDIAYRAGSTVPENWIPFIPRHESGSSRQVQLERAAMPRLIPGLPPEDVRPRTDLLTPFGTDPYRLQEEEIGAGGVVVARTYQRTRGVDGQTYLWLGRRTHIGRSSRSSGLRFDRIVDLVGDRDRDTGSS